MHNRRHRLDRALVEPWLLKFHFFASHEILASYWRFPGKGLVCILYVIPFFREGKVKQLILFNQSHPQVIHHPRFFGAFHCETLTVIHFTFLSKLIFKTPKSLPVSKGQRFPLFRALVHESRLCNIHWVRHHLFRKVEKIHKNQQPARTCTEKRKNNAYQESYSKKNL